MPPQATKLPGCLEAGKYHVMALDNSFHWSCSHAQSQSVSKTTARCGQYSSWGSSIETLKSSVDRLLGPADPLVYGRLESASRRVCAAVRYDAIQAGYRHFTCTCDYENETQVGHGVPLAIAEGLVKRDVISMSN